MIAIDTNILVYAHKRDAPLHAQAKAVLTALAESPDGWAIPWACLHEFSAVVTHPRVWDPPSTAAEALAQVEAWIASPSVRLLTESRDHLTQLSRLVETVRPTGASVHDAKIAAICLSHGVRELLTMDRDFSRYPSLKTRSLLA